MGTRGRGTILLPVKAPAEISPSNATTVHLVVLLRCVHESHPHQVHIAILYPLSLQKFTKEIAQVFIFLHDCKEMKFTSYYKSWAG